MNYQDAETYFYNHFLWHLLPETFQTLDATNWISKVITTFHAERGEEEATFWMIYDTQTHKKYTLSEELLRAIQEVRI